MEGSGQTVKMQIPEDGKTTRKSINYLLTDCVFVEIAYLVVVTVFTVLSAFFASWPPSTIPSPSGECTCRQRLFR